MSRCGCGLPAPADSVPQLSAAALPATIKLYKLSLFSVKPARGATMSLRSGVVAGVALLGTLAGGCATQGPQPTEEMTRARTLIQEADKSSAQRYAAADLQHAHDELADADKANAAGKYAEARSYAQSAEVDADLATARGASAEAQGAAREIQQSNATLRQEADRGTASGVASPN
jgi:hypothetical protein